MLPKQPSSSTTSFSALPHEIYHHILSFAVDRELFDPASRNQDIRTIASFQSLNRRISFEMKQMQTSFFNEFWWKVYERNFGINPEQKELESMKDEMIKKGEIKRKVILSNYIKFKVLKHHEGQELKTIVLGEDRVGKSALTVYFMNNVFMEDYDPGFQDFYRNHFIVDNIPAKMEIQVTAGVEEYSALLDSYIRCGNAFIIVCSAVDRGSITDLRHVVEQMLRLKDREVNDMPVVFAINKTDLVNDLKTLEECREEIKVIIQDSSLVNCSIVETSAKLGKNVTHLFEEVVRRHRYGSVENLKLLKKVIDLDSSCIKEYEKMMKSGDGKKCSLM